MTQLCLPITMPQEPALFNSIINISICNERFIFCRKKSVFAEKFTALPGEYSLGSPDHIPMVEEEKSKQYAWWVLLWLNG